MQQVPATNTGRQVTSYTPNTPEVLRSDIIVPYVVIAQAPSEAVKQRKAQMGDILRSTNLELLGGPEQPLDIVFLGYPKSNWIIEQKEGARFAYRRTEPRNAANETLPWNYIGDKDGNEVPQGTPGASEWRRVKQFLVFAILPRDIEAFEAEMKKVEAGDMPDPSKALTPVLISFRSTSFTAGKEVATFYTQARSMGQPMYLYKLKIGGVLAKNGDDSWYEWVVDRSKPVGVAKEHRPIIQEWVNILDQGTQLAVHEDGENQSDIPVGTTSDSIRATARDVC